MENNIAITTSISICVSSSQYNLLAWTRQDARQCFGTVAGENPSDRALPRTTEEHLLQSLWWRRGTRREDICLPEIMEQGCMPFLGQDGPQNCPRKNRGTDWGKPAPCQPNKPCGAQFLPGNRSQGQTLLRNATGVKKAFDSLCLYLQRCPLRCPDLPTEIPLLLKAEP